MRYAFPLLILGACSCGPKDGASFDFGRVLSALGSFAQRTAPAAAEIAAKRIEDAARDADRPGPCIAGMLGADAVRSAGAFAQDPTVIPARTIDIVGPCRLPVGDPIDIAPEAWIIFDAAATTARLFATEGAKGCRGKIASDAFGLHLDRLRSAGEAFAANPGAPIVLSAAPMPSCDDTDGGQ